MANDLVVRVGARLDDYQSALDKAGSLADGAVSSIENKFSNLNLGGGGLASLATKLGGTVAVLAAVYAGLVKINEQVAAIGKNAEYTGTQLERYQQIRFAATQGGLSGDQADTDLKRTADLLADAQRNENSLTSILDANNIKYKDRNGNIISTNELLTKAADLISRFDSIPDKTQAAKMLGLSAGWVDVLKGGPDVFNKIAASANSAGAIIDDATIKKAQLFDSEWKRASDAFGTYLKAQIADIGIRFSSMIDDIKKLPAYAEQAGRAIAQYFNIDSSSIDDAINKLKSAANIDTTAVQLKAQTGIAQDLEQVTRAIDFQKANGGSKDLISNLEEIQKQALETAGALKLVEAASAAAINGPTNTIPTPAPRPAAANGPPKPKGIIPARNTGGDDTDSFDRTIDSINKRTASIKADTAATLENNAVQAQYRAEFQLLNSIVKDGDEVTQQQLDTYEKLRSSMSATQALQASGINLTKEHADAFLSASTAIKSATEASDKAKDALKELNSVSATLGSALSTAFGDAIVDGKNLNDVMSSLLKTLEKAAINSIFTSFFNPKSAGGLSGFASILKGVGLPGFASGTDNAPGGLAIVGEKGPELVNLPRGSKVTPNALIGAGGQTGSQIQNNFMVSGDVSAATVERLKQAVIQANERTNKLSKIVTSQQRLTATGVG